jgi:hypothetical protein
MRRLHVHRGWHDGHDLVNWMNINRNGEFNDIIGYYRPGADPVHAATIQIGNFLKNRLGQTKIGERESPRRITLRGWREPRWLLQRVSLANHVGYGAGQLQ